MTRNAELAVIVVGASRGGAAELKVLLAALPKEFPLPVVIVQHRLKGRDDDLLHQLSAESGPVVSEPEDKEAIVPGHVYLAPADYHVMLEPGHISLSTEPAVNYSRPSIDVLFESAAETYGSGVIGVVLTGASNDGARGSVRIKQHGGLMVIEDPRTATVDVMPAAAILACKPDKVMPLAGIAPFLVHLCRDLPHPPLERG